MKEKLLVAVFLLIIVALTGVGVAGAMDDVVEDKINKFLTNIESQNTNVKFKYSEYEISEDGSPIIKNLVVVNINDGKMINIGDAQLNNFDFVNDFPLFYDAELNTTISANDIVVAMNIGQSDKDEATKFLSKFEEDGLLSVKSSIVYDYNPEKNNSFRQDFFIKLKNAGKISVSIKAENLDLITLSKLSKSNKVKGDIKGISHGKDTSANIQSLLSAITLKELSLSFEDYGALNEILKIVADREGLSVKELREKFHKNILENKEMANQNGLGSYADNMIKIFNEDKNISSFKLSIEPTFANLGEGFQVIMVEAMSGKPNVKKLEGLLNVKLEIK